MSGLMSFNQSSAVFTEGKSPASGAFWIRSSQASSLRVSHRRQRPSPGTGGTTLAMYFRNVFGHTRQWAADSKRFLRRGEFIDSHMFQSDAAGLAPPKESGSARASDGI